MTGQNLEDSRAVGRTLLCDIFDPISATIRRELEARGFDSFKDADHGIFQAKRIILAALGEPDAMPSPGPGHQDSHGPAARSRTVTLAVDWLELAEPGFRLLLGTPGLVGGEVWSRPRIGGRWAHSHQVPSESTTYATADEAKAALLGTLAGTAKADPAGDPADGVDDTHAWIARVIRMQRLLEAGVGRDDLDAAMQAPVGDADLLTADIILCTMNLAAGHRMRLFGSGRKPCTQETEQAGGELDR